MQQVGEDTGGGGAGGPRGREQRVRAAWRARRIVHPRRQAKRNTPLYLNIDLGVIGRRGR